MPLLDCVATLVLFYLFGTISAQTTHTVQVGVSGSFFEPPTLSAQLNDTVRFVFAGEYHSVTQSSFDAPCSPLRGGFNSGLAGLQGNSSAPLPIWSLQITNVSAPIWFFCENVRPASHCAQGMVGVINPPSIDLYNQFLAAAKAVVGTPAPTPSLALSGVGAVATDSPAPSTTQTPISAPPTSSAETSTSSSLTPSETPTVAPVSASSSNRGAIIGGTVGGLGGAIVLIAIAAFFFLRRRRRNTVKDTSTFFEYRVPQSSMALIRSAKFPGSGARQETTTRPIPPPVPVVPIIPLRHEPSEEKISNTYTAAHPYSAFADNKASPLDDDTGYQSMGYSDYNQHSRRNPSTQLFSSTQPPSSSTHNIHYAEKGESGVQLPMQYPQPQHVDGGDNVNLNTLAREVAAVLFHGPDTDERQERSEPAAPPPHYRSG